MTKESMDKKVVFIINSLSGGGAERVVAHDINEMAERGLDIGLITLKKEDREKSFIPMIENSISDEELKFVHFKSIYDIFAWKELIKTLCNWNPRAVVTHLWWSNTIGRIAAWISGVKKIITFEQNVYDNTKSRKQFLVDRILQHISDKIVTVSNGVKKSLVRHGIKAQKIEVIYNCISTDSYQAHSSQSKPQNLNAKNKFTFINVGSLTNQKNQQLLLYAFKKLDEEIDRPIQLFILGEGGKRKNLERIIESEGLQDKARLLGFIDNVAPYLRHSDCFVLSSDWEGLPLVVLEAMAAELPIISTKVAGVEEILENNETALLVEKKNVDALADAMKQVIAEDSLRRNITENAHKIVQNFSAENHVDNLLRIIEN